MSQVIEPSRLQKGIILLVETTAKVFEFEFLGGGRAILNGKGLKRDTPCQIVGSLDRNGTLFADKIVQENHLIIGLSTGRMVTGLVRSASLSGANWIYEMWTNE